MTDAVPGDTAMEVTVVDDVTVSMAVPVAVPPFWVKLAVIVEEPAVIPVASPPAAIVATAVLDELHVTREVMSFVVPLLYVPCAVNC